MFICHAPECDKERRAGEPWMPVSYKVVVPETGAVHCYDPQQYARAVEKWHEEITWLDCDTYLVRVQASVARAQVQPAPPIAVGTRVCLTSGKVSTTVTVPIVGPAVGSSLTTMV